MIRLRSMLSISPAVMSPCTPPPVMRTFLPSTSPVISPLISTSARQTTQPLTVPRMMMHVSEVTFPSMVSPSVKTFISREEAPSSRRGTAEAATGTAGDADASPSRAAALSETSEEDGSPRRPKRLIKPPLGSEAFCNSVSFIFSSI